jgi:hypothetical protein
VRQLKVALLSTATEYFYVLSKIGESGTSSVYLAYSIGGQVCVIKDYNLKTSSKGTDKGMLKEEKETRTIIKADAEEILCLHSRIGGKTLSFVTIWV